MPVSILVIRFSSLGDIILTKPVIAAIRAKDPLARVEFVTKAEYVEIVEELIRPDNVIALEPGAKLKSLKPYLAKRYTYVLDLHNSIRSRVLRRRIRGKKLVVHKRNFQRWLLVKFKINALKDAPDVIGRYFEAARALGVSDKGGPLASSSHARTNRVALCPGSKHWNKRWPTEYWIELGRELVTKGYAIDLYGSTADKEITSEIARAIPNATDFAGTLTLTEVADQLSACSLAITNDSGLMHLAQAVGTPVVAVFGPTVREFGFFPRGPQATVAENIGLYCRPCTAIGLDHCPEKHFRCMREIAPTAVIEKIEVLVNS